MSSRTTPRDGSGSSGVRGGVTEPAHLGDERTTLLSFLQRQRDLVAWKLQGADDDALRRVATPSGLAPHRLVRHLTLVERGWLRHVVAGEPDPDSAGRSRQEREQVDPGTTMDELLAEYRAESARCDEVVAASDLDRVSAERGVSLRWVLLHLVEETSRHLGHLDLLREQADGAVGEEP